MPELPEVETTRRKIEPLLRGNTIERIVHDAPHRYRDTHLAAIDARHLFAPNMTRLAIRRGAYLRDYAYEFIRTFASPLNREVVEQALAAPDSASLEL